MSGQELSTSFVNLSKVHGSKLNRICILARKKPNESIFVDRRPVIFKSVLAYLEADRKHLPDDVSDDMKKEVEQEFKHW